MLLAAAPTFLAHAGEAVDVHGHQAVTGTPLVLTALLVFGAALLLRSREPVISTVCLASVMAGAIHALVTPDHLQEDIRFGISFVALTVFQFGLAFALLRRPSMATFTLGASVNLMVLSVWVVSRTAGLPFGPHPGIPEAVGLLDSVSGVYELIVVAGCLWLGRHLPATNRFPTSLERG